MNKWLFKLKAESLKALFQHTHPSLSYFLFFYFLPQTITKKHWVHPHLYNDQATLAVHIYVYHFLPFPSDVTPSGSPTHMSPTYTLSSLQCDIGDTAKGSLMLLSMYPFLHSVICVMSRGCCPVSGFVFTRSEAKGPATAAWHSTVCYVSTLRITVPYMTLFDMLLVVLSPLVRAGAGIMYRIAPWQRETEPRFDSLAGSAHLIYSSSSPCMLSVRTEHDMSPSWQERSEKFSW